MPAPIRERVPALLSGILGQPAEFFRDDLQLDDVPGWGSLKLMQVLLAVERETGARPRPEDVLDLVTVGDLVRLAERAGGPA